MTEQTYDQVETEGVSATAGAGLSLAEPRGRPVGHGWVWFRESWSLFAPAWGKWMLTVLLLLVIMIGVQMLPMIGGLVGQLISPVLGAGVLYMAHRARQEGRFEIGDLFAAFRQRPGPLVGLGAINLVVTVLILAGVIGAMAATMGFSTLNEVDPSNEEAVAEAMGSLFSGSGALFGLIGLALFIPWMAAYWFAVPLVYFGEYGIGTALKTSLVGVVRNIVPMLWYSIILFVLAIVATIPLFLGWLVLGPVLAISYYSMFRDIFCPET